MARVPRTTGTPCLTVKASPELVSQLDELAAQTGQPRSVLIRWALTNLTADDLPPGWLESGPETRAMRQVRK